MTIRQRNSRPLKEKRAILAEAYSNPNNVKHTARKYGIQPSLMCRWKQTLRKADASITDAYNNDIQEPTSHDIRKVYNNKKLHLGKKSTSFS